MRAGAPQGVSGGATGAGIAESIAWHDAECGAYSADLELWSALASSAPGPVADLGCGTGRVALHLARRGHAVTGIDIDPDLAAELGRRASAEGLPAAALVGDVRSLDVESSFGLVIAPMQLIQLLAGPAERAACLSWVASHLSAGGRAAFAVVGAPPEAVDVAAPLPDVREVAGWVFSSLPLDVRVEEGRIEITRLRQIVSPAGEMTEDGDLVTLALLSPEALAEEARGCGLREVDRLEIPPTDDHLGSTVLVVSGR